MIERERANAVIADLIEEAGQAPSTAASVSASQAERDPRAGGFDVDRRVVARYARRRVPPATDFGAGWPFL